MALTTKLRAGREVETQEKETIRTLDKQLVRALRGKVSMHIWHIHAEYNDAVLSMSSRAHKSRKLLLKSYQCWQVRNHIWRTWLRCWRQQYQIWRWNWGAQGSLRGTLGREMMMMLQLGKLQVRSQTARWFITSKVHNTTLHFVRLGVNLSDAVKNAGACG